uniref:SFRICE_029064 n=1 Tax=Spodoptera frugiperda TaxID=7108 RepID=A0A2H1V4C8_SPOFR
MTSPTLGEAKEYNDSFQQRENNKVLRQEAIFNEEVNLGISFEHNLRSALNVLFLRKSNHLSFHVEDQGGGLCLAVDVSRLMMMMIMMKITSLPLGEARESLFTAMYSPSLFHETHSMTGERFMSAYTNIINAITINIEVKNICDFKLIIRRGHLSKTRYQTIQTPSLLHLELCLAPNTSGEYGGA